MRKTLQIDDHPIEINSSLGWLFIYREQFGHDILPDLLPLLDATLGALSEVYDNEADNIMEKLDEDVVNRIIVSLSTLEVLTVSNILWAMCKNAGETRSPMEWLNSFETFPMDIVVPELFKIIIESTVSTKNSNRLREKLPQLGLTPSSLAEHQGD